MRLLGRCAIGRVGRRTRREHRGKHNGIAKDAGSAEYNSGHNGHGTAEYAGGHDTDAGRDLEHPWSHDEYAGRNDGDTEHGSE